MTFTYQKESTFVTIYEKKLKGDNYYTISRWEIGGKLYLYHFNISEYQRSKKQTLAKFYRKYKSDQQAIKAGKALIKFIREMA